MENKYEIKRKARLEVKVNFLYFPALSLCTSLSVPLHITLESFFILLATSTYDGILSIDIFVTVIRTIADIAIEIWRKINFVHNHEIPWIPRSPSPFLSLTHTLFFFFPRQSLSALTRYIR